MLHITSLSDGLELFKALGSDTRMEILNILLENDSISMNELAKRMNLTNGALTSHIRKLEQCGLISTGGDAPGKHGNQKICSVCVDKILIELAKQTDSGDTYNTELQVGRYVNCRVSPACGLATPDALIGEVDDIRYFEHPDRYDAKILWFSKGFVEYVIPNFIPTAKKITQIRISAELSSAAPGSSNVHPSDISFHINGRQVGTWTSPSDYEKANGSFTPGWWYPSWKQYGILKLLMVNKDGTFIDGMQVSDVTIDDFDFDFRNGIHFRIAVDEHADHVGGLTIFGKSFGNYDQDINVCICYA